MFPDLSYVFQYFFGAHLPFLSVIKTFGFFVALAFWAGSTVLKRELQRKEALGELQPELIPDNNSKKKKVQHDSTPSYHWVYPHQRIGELIMIALLAGLVGAKVFNALESWDDFTRDPLGNLLSGSGLTFYGGLLLSSIVMLWYLKKHHIAILPFCDAIAPSLMLAYGIGRLGCHFAGDGDWGIFNSAYISASDGTLHQGSLAQYHQAIASAPDYIASSFHSYGQIPHFSLVAPSGIPRWMVAMNYPHNIAGEGIPIAGCAQTYCEVLPVGVFPTALYEAVICCALFGILWMLRKRFTAPLRLFGAYLVMNGLERFLVEKIRVDYQYDWGWLHPTQAEIISTVLILLGCFLMVKRNKAVKVPSPLHEAQKQHFQ